MLFLRLLRRIKWLFIKQWNSLSLNKWPYESCENCGKSFRICWLVEDKYWYSVMQRNDNGGGSLCVDCFLDQADKLGISIPPSAFKIEIFTPDNT